MRFAQQMLRVRQFAFRKVQEARYQFSGHVQIADARAIRTTGNAKRLGNKIRTVAHSKKELDSDGFGS